MDDLVNKLKFYFLLIFQTPSIFCTGFILYHFKWKRLQNQIYGILLIFNGLLLTTELPFTLFYLCHGSILFENHCTSWITLNYSLNLLSIILMVWTSIERYLFIYHERLIVQHSILCHYLPICLIMIYCPMVYIGIVVLYTCQPAYDVQMFLCGGACYQFERVLGLYDWIGNGIFMVLITFFVNLILIFRHLIQRYRMRGVVITADRRTRWRRSIKLIAQLLAITIPYLLSWIPYSIIVTIQTYGNTEQLTYLLSTYFVYMPYLQALVLPFLCILFLPEMKEKLLKIFGILRRKSTRIEPFTVGSRLPR